MVSLSRLFHKTEELDTKTAAVPTSAAPACAQTAEAKTASVELPQEFLDKFPGGMFRYKAESAGVIDRARPMCTAISRAVSAGLPSRRILW